MDGGDANLPRAFAIDVSLSIANAENVAPYDLSDDFYVAPGTYSYNPGTGEVNWGNPIVSAATDGFTIEMGSLWATNDPCHTSAPASSGSLMKFIVENDGTCITLEENAARAGVDSNGVVMEDTSLSYPAGYVDLVGTCVSFACLQEGQYVGGVLITAPMVTKWGEPTVPNPESWCYDCHWRGDTDGDCDVDSTDIFKFLDGWNDWANNPQGDTDNDGDVDSTDVFTALDGWNLGCTDPCHPDYPNSGTCTPIVP
jgi:hypothetical protein